jgi:hypothetical protein
VLSILVYQFIKSSLVYLVVQKYYILIIVTKHNLVATIETVADRPESRNSKGTATVRSTSSVLRLGEDGEVN